MGAGSEVRDTAVEGSDIDIVVVLKDFNHEHIHMYCEKGLEALGEPLTVKLRRMFHHGMKVSVCTYTDVRDMDIVFTGNPAEDKYNTPERYFISYHSSAQSAYVN